MASKFQYTEMDLKDSRIFPDEQRYPIDHMEGTVLVFESKTAANARVHARTHATRYRIPSICSSQCPNATFMQTSAQYVSCRNHAHRCIPFGPRSTSFDR